MVYEPSAVALDANVLCSYPITSVLLEAQLYQPNAPTGRRHLQQRGARAGRRVRNHECESARGNRRNSGKIFGVRLGREWHYPKLQFNAELRAFPEL
jgi:hypothetical protein